MCRIEEDALRLRALHCTTLQRITGHGCGVSSEIAAHTSVIYIIEIAMILPDFFYRVQHRLERVYLHTSSLPTPPLLTYIQCRLEDWIERFTSLFVAVNFPDDWLGKRTQVGW